LERKQVLFTKEETEVQLAFLQKARKLVIELYGEKMPSAYVHSFGCQQNVNDGEKLLGQLLSMGFSIAERPADADMVLYNTCAIRENAEKKVYGLVGALTHMKEQNPSMIIGLCGCMMQQQTSAEKIKKSYPKVDLVFGTHAMLQFPELMCSLLESRLSSKRRRIFQVTESDGRIIEGMPISRMEGKKANLPIMYGCNNFCTYCVVPLVRGRERSRRSVDVLREARELVAAGYKEITLLGQNVNSYGKDLADDLSFPELLKAINDIPGDFILRFMTSHPRDCTRELIDVIARCEKVCKSIHLPVQSGSDRILKEMNRHYTREKYLEIIRYAKEKIPDVTFTSDIIVGFPGETYEEFCETLSLIREVKYISLFTFIFSSREGTKASLMDDPVPYAEKNRWFQELLDTQREVGETLRRSMVGKTRRILVEGTAREEGFLFGRTEDNLVVDLKGQPQLIGSFAEVLITEAEGTALIGRLR